MSNRLYVAISEIIDFEVTLEGLVHIQGNLNNLPSVYVQSSLVNGLVMTSRRKTSRSAGWALILAAESKVVVSTKKRNTSWPI